MCSFKALGVGGKSGASQEEASKHVIVQPSGAFYFLQVSQRNPECIVKSYPSIQVSDPLYCECKQLYLLYGVVLSCIF